MAWRRYYACFGINMKDGDHQTVMSLMLMYWELEQDVLLLAMHSPHPGVRREVRPRCLHWAPLVFVCRARGRTGSIYTDTMPLMVTCHALVLQALNALDLEVVSRDSKDNCIIR